MDDTEKQIVELRTAVLNLFNATVESGEKVEQLIREISEMKDAQGKSDERLDAVIVRFEKFLENGNGDFNQRTGEK